MSDKPKRRWFQFRLRTMLVAVLAMAAVASWYGYRVRMLENERTRVAGRWYAAVDNVLALTWVTDEKQILMPNDGVGQLNAPFGDGSGISLGIYRCDGEDMVVALAEVGQPRPTSFEKTRGVYIFTATRRVPAEQKLLLNSATGQTLMRGSNGNWTIAKESP